MAKPVYPPIDIGHVFGKLTVVGRAENIYRQKRWICRCECGNETVVWQSSFRNGSSKSCGCAQQVGDLTGQKFGNLTVIKRDENVGSHKKWFCKCECGNETSVWQLSLQKGKSKSCGCIRDEDTKKRWEEYREPNFWARVNKEGKNGCWEWTGSVPQGKFPHVYPQVGYNGKVYRVHRLAYMLTNGPIPDGMMLLHSCDNPICCNPSHLRAGTHKENMQDMVDRERRKAINSGEKNGRSQITQKQAEEIRELYSGGEFNQTEIGYAYGISQMAVSLIVRNKRYISKDTV